MNDTKDLEYMIKHIDPDSFFSKSIKVSNHFIEAKYKRALTIEEQRVVLATIALLDDIEKDKYFYKLLIPKNLIVKVTYNHYNLLREALLGTLEKVFIVRKTESGEKIYPFFTSAEYDLNKDYIEVQIHPELIPYFTYLKENFTIFSLKHSLALSSKYSIRLYQLLKRFSDTNFRVDAIDELREKLGVESGKYTDWYDFEKRVLKSSIAEINTKTDLNVDYQKIKTGRKISHIKFFITRKESNHIELSNKAAEYELWINDKFQKYFVDYVKKEMPYIRNPIGFLIKMPEQNLKANVRAIIENALSIYEFQAKIDSNIQGFVDSIKLLYEKDFKLAFVYLFSNNEEEISMVKQIAKYRKYVK